MLTTEWMWQPAYMIKIDTALVRVAQWIEHWPTNQRVTGLIPSQGTCLCCGPGPVPSLGMLEATIDVSLTH